MLKHSFQLEFTSASKSQIGGLMADFLFSNNNGSVIKRLAQRSLKADKRRNRFVITTIIFTTILLSALCFYSSAQNVKLTNNIRGQYQAVCVDSSQDMIDILSKQPKVQQWGISKIIGAARYQDTALSVLYEDENQIKLAKRPEIIGRLPEKQNEIMVERAFLQYLKREAETGQSIVMDLGDGTKRSYTITGILQSENESRQFTVFVSKEYITVNTSDLPVFDFRFRFAGGNELEKDLLKEEIKKFLVEQGVPERNIFYSSNYFDLVGLQTSDPTPKYLVGAILMIACGVVIYSLFYISVISKLQSFGRLKVIGASSKQLKRIVRRETLLLSIRSIPIGIVLAGIAVFGYLPNEWNWRSNLQSALGVAAVMLLVVIISTSTPIRLAGKVSAIEAVRTTSCAYRKGVAVSKKSYRMITPVSLARMNFMRRRKQSVLSLISLGLTGIILMSVATYSESFDVESMAARELGDGGNYLLDLTASDHETQIQFLKENPLNEALYQKLLNIESVQKITRYSGIYAEVDLPERSDYIGFMGFSEKQRDQFLSPSFMITGEADYDKMIEHNGVIINDSQNLLKQFYNYTPQTGDILSCKGQDGNTIKLEVLGISKGTIKTGVSGLFVVTEETLSKLFPEVSNFNTVWNIHAIADSEELRQTIYTAVDDGRIDITSRNDIAIQLQSGAEWTIRAAYVLVVFLFVFAVLNLVNTLMTSLISRQQELGVLQSVGMSRKQISSMLSMECFCYIVGALLITIVIGGLAGLAVCSIFNQIGILGTLTYHFPLRPLMVYIGFLMLIQCCYSVIATHYLQKRSLIDRIKVTE